MCKCTYCRGKGWYWFPVKETLFTFYVTEMGMCECPVCEGTGLLLFNDCYDILQNITPKRFWKEAS